MIEIQKSERDRREDLLVAVALCLTVGVMLVIISAIVTSGRFSEAGSMSIRNRLELISSESANIGTAALALAAVVALSFVRAERLLRVRPLVVAALLVAVTIALIATFSVVDVLTVHIPGPNSQDTFSIALSRGTTATDRIGAVLPAAGTAFIALVAMVGASRIGKAEAG